MLLLCDMACHPSALCIMWPYLALRQRCSAKDGCPAPVSEHNLVSQALLHAASRHGEPSVLSLSAHLPQAK